MRRNDEMMQVLFTVGMTIAGPLATVGPLFWAINRTTKVDR